MALDFLVDASDEFLDELAEEVGVDAAHRFMDLFRSRKEHGTEGAQAPAAAYAGVRRIQADQRESDKIEEDTGAAWVNPLDETEDLLARECRAWEEFERCR